MSHNRLTVGEKARDFTLIDTFNQPISLADFKEKKNIFLVFNRGFS